MIARNVFDPLNKWFGYIDANYSENNDNERNPITDQPPSTTNRGITSLLYQYSESGLILQQLFRSMDTIYSERRPWTRRFMEQWIIHLFVCP